MGEKQTFTVPLEKHESMEATGITIPFDVEQVFGAKRVPVKALVNGAEYRGTIVRMEGKYMLGIPKVFRDAAGVNAGDNIVVTIERDNEPRTIAVPPDLEKALKDAGIRELWDKLSFNHRKEHVRAILEAKRPETRTKRIEKAVKMMIT
ncbi:MAG: YdeI/OmpD-associated family protein [Pyrinomonadaceae bacterium]